MDSLLMTSQNVLTPIFSTARWSQNMTTTLAFSYTNIQTRKPKQDKSKKEKSKQEKSQQEKSKEER